MGRTEKSQGLAPPAVRKDIRAKQARHIINKTIPAILAANSKARYSCDASELIADPQPILGSPAEGQESGSENVAYVKRKGQGRRKAKGGGDKDDVIIRSGYEREAEVKDKGQQKQNLPDKNLPNFQINSAPVSNFVTAAKAKRCIRLIKTDTLTAAHMLTFPSKYPFANGTPSRPGKKAPNVCILNMASPLRPGGGVLSGATSQEEYLCSRTTLLPSLKETFYRLPELGGIYTRNVFVFRNALPLGDSKGELGPGERYWVDVISAGMLRFPELEGDDDEVKRLGRKDREIVEAKMHAVLRIAARKGLRRLVLGAWGCGAYGNPVYDIAKAWKNSLDGSGFSGGHCGKKNTTSTGESDTWDCIEEVTFAIPGSKLAKDFAEAFGGGLTVENGPHEQEEDLDEIDEGTEELKRKITEMESQVSSVWNPGLRERLGSILEGLRQQLKEKQRLGRDADEYGLSDEDVNLNEGPHDEGSSDEEPWSKTSK